jgi:hypothetical protein
LQCFEIADDDLEKVVEIMGDTAREVADGFHLLRLSQGLFVLLKLAGAFGDFILKIRVQLGKAVLGPCALGKLFLDGRR